MPRGLVSFWRAPVVFSVESLKKDILLLGQLWDLFTSECSKRICSIGLVYRAKDVPINFFGNLAGENQSDGFSDHLVSGARARQSSFCQPIYHHPSYVLK